MIWSWLKQTFTNKVCETTETTSKLASKFTGIFPIVAIFLSPKAQSCLESFQSQPIPDSVQASSSEIFLLDLLLCTNRSYHQNLSNSSLRHNKQLQKWTLREQNMFQMKTVKICDNQNITWCLVTLGWGCLWCCQWVEVAVTGCAWLCQGLAPGNAVMVCCSAGAGAGGKAKEGREEATHYRLYTLRTAAMLSAL